jgi:hypothetical protein
VQESILINLVYLTREKRKEKKKKKRKIWDDITTRLERIATTPAHLALSLLVGPVTCNATTAPREVDAAMQAYNTVQGD